MRSVLLIMVLMLPFLAIAGEPPATVAPAVKAPTDATSPATGQGVERGVARRELERFSSGLSSLQLDFTQVVKSQDGSIQDQTAGQAWLQQPDRLRWVYTGDFPETIVADGVNVWIYDEALQQVTVKPQSDQLSNTPLLVMTDLSQIDQQFQVAEMGDFEDMQLLELKSRDPEAEFERVLIGLDASGIRMMIMEDAFGQRTEIRFQIVVRNPPLAAGLFKFSPPAGVDVVGEALPTE